MKFFFSFFLLILLSTPIFAQKRVACIGNSVTYGYLIADRDKFSYPAVLQQMLGEKFEVKNFGHSGATLLHKGHNPYLKLNEWKEAKEFKPDIAIIHLGLNDTDPRNWPNFKDEFRANYGSFIDTLRIINPQVRIIICKMTPIFSYHPRFLSGTRTWYAQIQNQIEKVAAVYQTELVDLNTALYNHPNYYFEDALHPNAKGAEVIAKTLYQRILGNYGGLSLAEVFASHMVLQRDKEIPIWGKANVGAVVNVRFGAIQKQTKANENGDWKLVFPAMPATGKAHQIIVQNAQQKIVLEDVLMGDVWLCSGQSNMDFELQYSSTATQEFQNWNQDSVKNMRWMQHVQNAKTDAKAWDSTALNLTNDLQFFKAQWKRTTLAEAKLFSAIAYYFGKQLSNDLKIPIGIVQIAVGGSPIVSWIDRKTLEHTDFWAQNIHRWKESDFIQPWVRERAKLNLSNAKEPLQRHPYEPAYNFEAAIAKWTHTPIKGVLWYQGESDAHNVELYAQNLKLLVDSWRALWQTDFPFYWVQLSALNRPTWALFRNMQREMLGNVSNSGMVVSSDWGDENDVHPKHKKEIGQRLAQLALLNTYQKGNPNQISPFHPTLLRATSNTIEIAIDHCETLKTSNKETPYGIELFLTNGKRIPVSNIILEKNKIIIPFPKAQMVARVVYAWEPYTKANLVNELGFPLSTFQLQIKK